MAERITGHTELIGLIATPDSSQHVAHHAQRGFRPSRAGLRLSRF